jgi:hypothetical protein
MSVRENKRFICGIFPFYFRVESFPVSLYVDRAEYDEDIFTGTCDDCLLNLC